MIRNGGGLIALCIGTLFLIPVSLIYRFIFFLINGYNPKVSIETFFPQSSSEFGWKGLVTFSLSGVINKVKHSLLSKN